VIQVFLSVHFAELNTVSAPPPFAKAVYSSRRGPTLLLLSAAPTADPVNDGFDQ
jgi:hypothetical protein